MTQNIKTIKEAFLDYKRLEKAWFKALPKHKLDIITDKNRVPIDELHLYGEIGFFLLGFKSCVLIEHITKDFNILETYIKDVCEKWIKEINRNKEYDHFFGFTIKNGLESPELTLDGCYILANRNHENFQLLEKYFLQSNNGIIEESVLAKLLDYPGSLPTSTQEYSTMIRVGYIEKKTGYWLTTYAGQKRQSESIKEHFLKYYDKFGEHFDSELQISIEELG